MSALDAQGAGAEEVAPVITAWAEIGSAVSRNNAGSRHVVRLSGRRSSLVVAGALSETAATHLAEAINEFLADCLAELLLAEHGKNSSAS